MAYNPKKDLKMYYSIGEVAKMFDVNESLLRYWEKEFPIISPKKAGGNIRQYRKLIGSSVEVLLLSGVKLLAKLDAVTEEGISISYEEKQAVEGKKRKVLVNVERTFRFDEIKYTKEYLDFK